MTWFAETFYWRPCKAQYDSSIHLYIEDGWKIRLDLDDCRAPEQYNCMCQEELDFSCGCDDTALSKLTIDELHDLHAAIGEALDYYYEQRKTDKCQSP